MPFIHLPPTSLPLSPFLLLSGRVCELGGGQARLIPHYPSVGVVSSSMGGELGNGGREEELFFTTYPFV